MHLSGGPSFILELLNSCSSVSVSMVKTLDFSSCGGVEGNNRTFFAWIRVLKIHIFLKVFVCQKIKGIKCQSLLLTLYFGS